MKNYANQTALPFISDDSLIVGALPYNAQVTPYLKINTTAGQTITIRTDNYRAVRLL